MSSGSDYGDDALNISASDLDRAVKASVLEHETALALVQFTLGHRRAPEQAEDEQLRLVTGFGDIFVTIGLVLVFGSLVFIGGQLAPAALLFASWGLAEVFTRWKRMALPSMVLLMVFVVSAYFLLPTFLGHRTLFNLTDLNWMTALSSTVALAAAAVHWWRFRVPVTIAAVAGSIVLMLTSALAMVSSGLFKSIPAVYAVCGFAVFAMAMVFDSRDRLRRTRNADIAFWLHMLAAPLIIHPVASLVILGVASSTSETGLVLIVFVVLGFVALVIDRRALLVSSLSYLIYMIGSAAVAAGIGGAAWPFAVLIVGALVLGLSLAWRPARRWCLGVVPAAIRELVPPPDADYPKPRAS